MIKAIVFDLGGVLFDLDTDACIRAFREGLGFEKIVEILDKCHQKGIIGQLECGDLSADEFRAEVLPDHDAHGRAHREERAEKEVRHRARHVHRRHLTDARRPLCE